MLSRPRGGRTIDACSSARSRPSPRRCWSSPRPRGPTPSRRSTPPGLPPARLRCAPIRGSPARPAPTRATWSRAATSPTSRRPAPPSRCGSPAPGGPTGTAAGAWARRSRGSGPLASPDAIVAAWLNSPAHRRIALARRWRVVGIGVASGTPFATPGATFTADFGTSVVHARRAGSTVRWCSRRANTDEIDHERSPTVSVARTLPVSLQAAARASSPDTPPPGRRAIPSRTAPPPSLLAVRPSDRPEPN